MRFHPLAVAVLGGALLFAGGCAAARSPVTGFLYSDVKANDSVTANTAATKVGRATATSILGWVATGDCSLDAAKKQGGITKVAHVDYESTSIIGIYATTTTVVYGE